MMAVYILPASVSITRIDLRGSCTVGALHFAGRPKSSGDAFQTVICRQSTARFRVAAVAPFTLNFGG